MSPSGTQISVSTPAAIAGTSIEVLSVSISNRLSPGLTASPAALNHLVILPSATVSPSCGIKISISAPRPRPNSFYKRPTRFLPRQRHVLGFHELHQPLVRAFAADAALLHAAERRGWIRDEAAVEPDHAKIEPLGHAHAAAEVARVDVGDKPVLGVVGALDHLILGAKG